MHFRGGSTTFVSYLHRNIAILSTTRHFLRFVAPEASSCSSQYTASSCAWLVCTGGGGGGCHASPITILISSITSVATINFSLEKVQHLFEGSNYFHSTHS